MDTYQAFFLGLMVAYTPSLIFFAWRLWRVSSNDKHARERRALLAKQLRRAKPGIRGSATAK
jgi:hypothetical protein